MFQLPAVSDLSEGELAYVQDRSNSGAGAKLYIESVDSDNSTPLIQAIGGKYYTDILAGSAATPSNFKVGNGSTAGASVSLMEDSDNGTNFVALKAADTLATSTTFTLPSADGSANQVIATDGSGSTFILFQQLQLLQVLQTQIFLLHLQHKFLCMTVQIHLTMLAYQEMQH